jgi:quercetin dioxygenase-like cupin family protein
MKIEFKNMESEIKNNFNNGEKYFEVKTFNDGLNKIMQGKLIPGASIGLHTHTDSSEIIYVLSCSGKNICDGIEERLIPGDVHYCKKGSNHTFINDGNEDLIFLAIVPKQ